MSDKDIKKAHIEEIELEIPMDEYIAPEQPRTVRRKRPSNTQRNKNNEKDTFFQKAIVAAKESAKAGLEVVKSYKEEILAKREKEEITVIKPNDALIEMAENREEEETHIEIEFAKEQPSQPKTQYKMSKAPEEFKASTTYENVENQSPRPRKKKSAINKNRPSGSASARAGSFVDLFDNDEEKKPLISDKDFRRFVGIASSLLVLFGLVWYGFTYMSTDDIPKLNMGSTDNYPGPIKPSELFASRTPEIVELLGKPKASGTIDGTTNGFMEYEDKWFGSAATSKIVHGADKRVYSVDIAFKDATMKKVYPEMVKYLGEPISNNPETKEAVWFVDSSMYALIEEDGKTNLNIQIPLYDNVNGYPIAIGAIIIQKQGSYDVTGDGKNDVVVIIGEKENYIFREFTKLHMTIWEGEEVFYTNFPADTDGGSNPKITYEDVDKDGITDISIETKNNAISNYNTFTVKNAAISSIYASHEKSK